MQKIQFRIVALLILLVLISLPLVSGLIAPNLPPSPPKNLTGECENGKVILTWQPSTASKEHPVIWYYIYRGLSSGNESFYTKVDASMTSYIDTNVKVGTTYYYYVTAVNDVGESNSSNEINVTVKKVINPPQPPRDLFAITGEGYVLLMWKPPVYNGGAPIVSYNIYRNGKILASLSPGLTHYNDTNVNIKNKYTYYVTALNKAGESTPSNKITVSWTLPQPPQNLKAINMENYLLLTWTPGDSGGLKIKDYKIYEKQGDKWSLIGTTTNTSYKLKVPYSIFGGTLEIKVTEVTALGESQGSVIKIPLSSDIFMISLVVILSILVIILLLLLYRRRKTQKKT